MNKISYTQVVDLVQMAIEEKGENYQYHRPFIEGQPDRCVYYDANGDPSCLIGHVLYRLGYVFAPLSSLNMMGASEVLSTLHISIDATTMTLIEEIQRRQDCGVEWGACFRAARICAGETLSEAEEIESAKVD